MLKRGQVTIFVIIAIIIVVGIAVFIIARTGVIKPAVSAEEAQKIVASQVQPVQDLVETCIAEISADYFGRVGEHAGFYSYISLQKIDYDGDKIIVAYKDSRGFVNMLPSLATISNEFEHFLRIEGYQKIDNCTQDFRQFKKIVDVKQDISLRNSIVHYPNKYVSISMTWPITISKGGATTTIQDYKALLPIPIDDLLSVSNDIVTYETRSIPFENVVDMYGEDNAQGKLLRIRIENIISHPDAEHKIFLLKSIPYRPSEEEIGFYFAVNRA